MIIDAKTKLMGLIGHPIAHSKSPLIQNMLADMLEDNVRYLCFDIKKSDLREAVLGLKSLNASGFNITIPYKEDVLPFLDEADDIVRRVLACNTIKIKNGKLYGFNTDLEGFIQGFKYDTNKSFEDKKVVIIGAGGASRGVIHSLMLSKPASICLLNRTIEKARAIKNEFYSIYEYEMDIDELEQDKANSILEKSDIIINTTSVGMHPDVNQNPIRFFNNYNKNQIVYDIIYNPTETMMLKEAKEKGCVIGNGLSMLVFQAIIAYEHIHETKVSEEIRDRLIKEVKQKVEGERRCL